LKLLPSAVASKLAEQAQMSDVMRSAIVTECKTVIAANYPAEPLEVAALVRRLMNHYRTPEMSDADMQGVIEDWLEDLGSVPFDILRDAMATFRQSPKGRFKPMPGDILEAVSEQAAYRMKLAERARNALTAIENYQPKPEAGDENVVPFRA
jgi:hypothetical protein